MVRRENVSRKTMHCVPCASFGLSKPARRVERDAGAESLDPTAEDGAYRAGSPGSNSNWTPAISSSSPA